MLINSLYSEEQLTEEGIKEYLKRISTLIQRDEIRRTEKKTMSEYKKPDGNLSRTTWEHGGDSIKLNEFSKKKRKCFKYEKVDYIRRFYRSKESLSKGKEDILVVFKKSKNENVLERKESQDEKL